MKLYKYYSPISLSIESILVKQEVYYSSPHKFNDPFEAQPVIKMPSKNYIVKELKELNVQKTSIPSKTRRLQKHLKKELPNYENKMKEFLGKFGVFCLTESNSNLLMWAHYGQDHKGLCFEFDINIDHVTDFGLVNEVTYNEKYPYINMLDLHMVFNGRESDSNLLSKVFNNLLLTKSIDWSYEKEYRALLTPFTYGGFGLKTFDPKSLKGVIIGARANKDFINKIEILVENYPEELYIKHAKISNKKFEVIVN
ncbi:MAG: DUF2971 domain-containing protein [Methylococcaceae bacterium]